MSMTVQAVRIQLFIRVLTVSILNGLVGWLAVVGYSIGTIACSFHCNVNDSTGSPHTIVYPGVDS